MTDTARYAALDARTMEIRGRVETGYTLEDKGEEDQPGRNMNYWQRQADGSWFDLGERAEITWATNSHGGIVIGSSSTYKISINTDGTMSVNGLQEKLDEIDAKDSEQDGRLDADEEAFTDFKTAQETFNSEVLEKLDEIEDKDNEQDGRLDAIETKNAEQNTALENEISNRQYADGQLQTLIDNETTAREEADNTKIDKSAIELSATTGQRTVLTGIAPTDIQNNKVTLTAFNSDVENPGTFTQTPLVIEGENVEFQATAEGLKITAQAAAQNGGLSEDDVQDAINTHNTDELAHPEIRNKITGRYCGSFATLDDVQGIYVDYLPFVPQANDFVTIQDDTPAPVDMFLNV